MKRIEIYIGLSVFALSAKSQVKESRPNVIYIIMDDLGYGDIGCYGSEKIETPNIDRLYKDGISFTQHYTGSPVSAPARCVLMTGMHSGHAQIRANDEMAYRGAIMNYDSMYVHPGLEGQYPLKAYTMTLGRMMQQAGYVTGCFGKWGLGAPGTEGTPNKQGFDSFYGYNCQRQAHSYYPAFLYKNEDRVYLANKVLDPHTTKLDAGADPRDEAAYAKFSQKEYANDLIFDELISFVGQNRKKPFFLMWTTPLPHVSLQAPEKWVKYYVGKFGDEAPYIGKAGIRIPAIVTWPGKIKPSTQSDHICGFQDVMPTLADIANIACPETDGISFLPALLGETERQKEHEYLYWEYPDPTIGLKAIRMGKWKGIVNNIRKGNSTMELYDLESDLREEHDVAAEHPDIVRKLTRLMEKSHTEPENPKFRF